MKPVNTTNRWLLHDGDGFLSAFELKPDGLAKWSTHPDPSKAILFRTYGFARVAAFFLDAYVPFLFTPIPPNP